MLSRFAFMITALLALCVWFAPQSAAQTSSRITVEICCSSQQKVDQPHGVTLEVKKPDGTTAAFSVSIPAGTKAADVAAKIAAALRSNGIAVADPTPNTHPRFAEGTAWDVLLPAGHVLAKAKVQKKVDGHWQSDDGHLKIRDNKTKVSNSDGVATEDCSSASCLAPMNTQSFNTLDFSQQAWIGDAKGIEIFLRGLDASGAPFTYTKTIEYAVGDTLPPNAFDAVGAFLASLGMTVTYPTASDMHVVLSSSGLSVQEVEFTIYDASTPAMNDWTAAWGLAAQ